MEDLLQQEQLVEDYVGKGDKEAAVKLLFDLIVKYAEERNFGKAEALRERLFEVDSMALDQIIKSGEMIDTGKRKSIDQSHLDLWEALYGGLDAEETNALYYALKPGRYEPDQKIFRQGERDANLYLFQEGRVRLGFDREGEEIEIATLDKGDFAGEENLFHFTVCTTSATALTPVTVSVLGEDCVAKWESEFPGLERKLREFCLKAERTPELLKKKNLDRRAVERSDISGKMGVQILNNSGAPAGKAFRAEGSNISSGGCSFFIKISKKETAARLLGRTLNMQFVPSPDRPQGIVRKGKIVAVRSHLFDDYSMHIRFKDIMSEETVRGIAGVSRSR